MYSSLGERSYTVVYQKYIKENAVSSEISIQNKTEMSFQMERHRTYFRTREMAPPGLENLCQVLHSGYYKWIVSNYRILTAELNYRFTQNLPKYLA